MGSWKFTKRTAEYVLTSADIQSVGNGTNGQFVYFKKPTDFIGYGNLLNLASFKINGYSEFSSFWDSSTNLYKVGTNVNNNSFMLVVPLGTYADVASAQAALTGTKIVYQLATPIIIEEKDFPTYGITVQGSLTSNTDFTEYFVDNYDILALTTITYPTNLSKAVENLKESSQSIRTVLSTPTSLIPITTGFLTNWSGTIRYGKSREGFVSVYIDLLRSADILSTAEILYTLPLGFRPTGAITSTVNLLSSTDVSVASSYANISINTSGQITILPVTSTTLTNARSIMLTFNYYSA